MRTLKVDGEPIRRPPATKKTKNATVNGLNEIQKGQKLKIKGKEYGVIKTVCDRTNPKQLKIILTLGTPIAADQISEAIAAAAEAAEAETEEKAKAAAMKQAAEEAAAAAKSVGRLFINDNEVKFCKFKKDPKQRANPLTLTTDTDKR